MVQEASGCFPQIHLWLHVSLWQKGNQDPGPASQCSPFLSFWHMFFEVSENTIKQHSILQSSISNFFLEFGRPVCRPRGIGGPEPESGAPGARGRELGGWGAPGPEGAAPATSPAAGKVQPPRGPGTRTVPIVATAAPRTSAACAKRPRRGPGERGGRGRPAEAARRKWPWAVGKGSP